MFLFKFFTPYDREVCLCSCRYFGYDTKDISAYPQVGMFVHDSMNIFAHVQV